jgi:thymidine kinase
MKRLMVWFGPTSSSKSTGALGMAHRFKEQGRNVILVRPARSVRAYEALGGFLTKDGNPWPSIDVETPDDIQRVAKRDHPDVIWIDEPALFRDEQVADLPPWLFQTVTKLRKTYTILISGIGATSELEVFGKSLPLLMAVADEVVQCKGDCPWCDRMNVATRTVYLADEEKITQDKVGGVDMYQPACVECWTEMQHYAPSARRLKMKRALSLT